MTGLAFATDGDLDNPFFGIEQDNNKSAQELVDEASILFKDERPLDARSKLLKALEKDPANYEAQMLLGGYYLFHVGHYRLSIKYIKQSKKLFEQRYGQPPYSDEKLKNDHARILYLLSESRLNLDNYQGALDTLDEYSKYYYGLWYPGSRAWVLMKLGRLDEAIRIARLGILTGAEPGRTLNILGILLSMKGERQNSLKVFNEAISYELALGSTGQPATPLNNSGEVYREIFLEDKAEGSWLKAVSMPDGCEHVLPSLNLVILFNEQLRFERAKWAMDNFESCIVQFPLRNGEEHRAFVHLARGRIALHTGHIDKALEHLEEAMERQQWFGKIGTDVEDLQVASHISMAQALRAKNEELRTKLDLSPLERVASIKQRVYNALRAWWLMRRATQILTDQLNNIEDLYVRNTDSMIEYFSFGEALKSIPSSILEQRIDAEESSDQRKNAKLYYEAYLIENDLGSKEDIQKLDKLINATREKADEALKLHLLLLKLSLLETKSDTYRKTALLAYELAPASIRNKGFKLPIILHNFSSSEESKIQGGNFTAVKNSPYDIELHRSSGKFTLKFSANTKGVHYEAAGDSIESAIDALSEKVFTE